MNISTIFNIAGRIATVLTLLFSIVFLTATSSGRFDHNDFMYAVAPRMDGILYEDIHYVQAPLSFYYLKALSLLFPETLAYTAPRVASIVLTALAIVIGGYLALGSNIARIGFFLLASSNWFLISGAFEIGTYSFPLLLLAASTALLAISHNSMLKNRIIPAILGLFLGLATSFKLSYLLLLCFGAIFVFFFWKGRVRIADNLVYLACYCLGAAVGTLPILVEMFLSPAAFWVHNITFHTSWGNAARGLDLFKSAKSVWSELRYWLISGGVVLLALGTSIFIGTQLNCRASRLAIFTVFMGVASFLAAFAPGVGFKQYYIPVSYCAILLACQALDASGRGESKSNYVLSGLVTASILLLQVLEMYPRALESLRNPSVWEEVSRINKVIQTKLVNFDQHKCQPDIFSHSGAYVLGTGFPLSRFTEGGIFWARMADFVPEKILVYPEVYKVPRELVQPHEYVKAKGINIILVGYYFGGSDKERLAEQRLRNYSIQAGYIKKRISTVLVRPADAVIHAGKRELELWINPKCLTTPKRQHNSLPSQR
jgi:hypothetical protein